MNRVSAEEVRSVILTALEAQFELRGESARAVGDDVDLFAEGVIDSMGMLEMFAAVEQHFGIQISVEKIPQKTLTTIGFLCGYLEETYGSSATSSTPSKLTAQEAAA